MVETTIVELSVRELEASIMAKETEYKEVIKAKKVFWEVKRIMEQKRELERQFIRKCVEQLPHGLEV